MVKSLNQDAIK